MTARDPTQPARLSTRQYSSYLLVGVFVGLVTVGLREVIGALLPADTPFYYSVSIVVVYAIGILLSFVMQRLLTFKSTMACSLIGDLPRLGRFIVVAGIGAGATWLIALGLRYGLAFDTIFGRYGASMAFGVAAVVASLITYSLNATVVFVADSQFRPETNTSMNRPK